MIEERLRDLGISLPAPSLGDLDFYGKKYGKMKPFFKTGSLLYLSGHIAGFKDGEILFPGVIGKDLTVEQGYEAARLAGINCLAGIRDAIGSLDGVAGLARSINYIVCVPGFTEPNRISNGMTDLFAEVFGEDVGVGPRASIGVTSLADNACYETVVTIGLKDGY